MIIREWDNMVVYMICTWIESCAVIGWCPVASSYDWTPAVTVSIQCLSVCCFRRKRWVNKEQEVGRRVWTDLEQTGGELLQLLAKLVSDFRQPLTLLILQQELLTHTNVQAHKNTPQNKTAKWTCEKNSVTRKHEEIISEMCKRAEEDSENSFRRSALKILILSELLLKIYVALILLEIRSINHKKCKQITKDMLSTAYNWDTQKCSHMQGHTHT